MMFKNIWIYSFLSCLWIGCSFTQKIHTGKQAYDVKQFAIATQLFEKEYAASRTPQEKAYVAFFAGESYTRLNDPSSAAQWYNHAYTDGFGVDALERYAVALKQQEKYQEAIQAYQDLLRMVPNHAGYRGNITLCNQAMEWKKNANPAYEIAPVAFNSPGADYAPQPIGRGLVLFTSDRDSRQSTNSYLWTGRAFSDLYVSNAIQGSVTPFDSKINSSDNDGTAVISPDGNVLIFTRCYVDKVYDAWCKLMISYRRGNAWSEPQPLSFVRDKVNYGQPAFAANGTTLFFSSDAPEGNGGHDIYFSQVDGSGIWSEPVNLGPLVNTIGEEQYPTTYKDTLYFSSNQLAGLGGLDIFKTYLDIQGQWVSPINLRAPVNSGGDDFGFVVDTFASLGEHVLMQGYFTSSRAGVSKNDDIYAFTIKGISKSIDVAEPSKPQKGIPKPVEQKLFIAFRVVGTEYEIKDDPNSKKVGQRILPNGPIIVTEGRLDERFVTNESGQLLLQLEWGQEYIFTARYRDHLASSATIHTGEVVRNKDNPITTINQLFELDPIVKNKEILLENIFYDYDQWAIRDDAKPSLNYLGKILKTNPGIRILLTSHTDCRGTEEYNLDLSQKRAQAAIEYLMSSGIPPKRLEAQGLGKTNLAISCPCETCTEQQHQSNRRTTFTIID